MKCDSVVKQCVLGQDVNDGKTLNKDFAKDFKVNKGRETADCSVIKATWLSNVDTEKKIGSVVVWLKSKIDALFITGRHGYVGRDRRILLTFYR